MWRRAGNGALVYSMKGHQLRTPWDSHFYIRRWWLAGEVEAGGRVRGADVSSVKMQLAGGAVRRHDQQGCELKTDRLATGENKATQRLSQFTQGAR